ncbi:UDP-N-acetylglucosamine 2-epimerase [Brevibacillus sp. B_LB10_24]|uniref:UDP-N-acetylglucosamine 2-epimerase n=1 Tax=Brevibacillus sp. B_LB10_24 TaxID=3380645 RepID=UPI0038B9E1A6
MKRKICVVTGTRAEYGLLYWLMKEIQEDPELQLQIIATGMHLSPEFGLTYKNIEQDGFRINEKVEMLLSSDTAVGITKSVGLATIGFADALDRLKPDILVLLGDRYEILAAAQAALIARIPIAHLHGGESTEGLIDEAIRHAVSKMAHFHFVAAEPYRQRVIQLGENPEKVFNYGALALDNINNLKLLSKEDFECTTGFTLGQKNALITYHPVTLSKKSPEVAMYNLFQALDEFKDLHVIFTKPNSDTSSRIICKMIDEYVAGNKERMKAYTSLGTVRYLSAISLVDLVIGNSSSGIIEVPYLRKPTVNIGDRQRGRLKPLSVLDCNETTDDIKKAISKAMSSEFTDLVKVINSPYGEGNVAIRIKDELKNAKLEGILYKKFFDVVN